MTALELTTVRKFGQARGLGVLESVWRHADIRVATCFRQNVTQPPDLFFPKTFCRGLPRDCLHGLSSHRAHRLVLMLFGKFPKRPTVERALWCAILLLQL